MDNATPELNRIQAERLQQRLLIIYKDGPEHPELGICSNIDPEFNEDWDHWLEEMFECWPHYSGYAAYPVPHPDKPKDEDEAINCYHRHACKWEGVYGELRIALLEYLITNLTNQLNEGYHNAP